MTKTITKTDDVIEELQETGERVKVARNLNKAQLSIRRKGKVAGYVNWLVLTDVEFRVSEAGRQRCIQEKRKNVHAFAEGRISGHDERYSSNFSAVSYNPYKGPHFYETESGKAISGAKHLAIHASGGMVAFDPIYVDTTTEEK